MKRKHIHARLDPRLIEDARTVARLRGVTVTSLLEEGLRRLVGEAMTNKRAAPESKVEPS